jgi:hypothetical protein
MRIVSQGGARGKKARKRRRGGRRGNRVENSIRPFVVGRKNWLFADTVAGARASANLYGLIETAKANRIEPGRYLEYVFERLPAATLPKEIDALLPQNVDLEAPSAR